MFFLRIIWESFGANRAGKKKLARAAGGGGVFRGAGELILDGLFAFARGPFAYCDCFDHFIFPTLRVRLRAK